MGNKSRSFAAGDTAADNAALRALLVAAWAAHCRHDESCICPWDLDKLEQAKGERS